MSDIRFWRGEKDFAYLVERHSAAYTPRELAIAHLYFYHGFDHLVIGQALCTSRMSIARAITRLIAKLGRNVCIPGIDRRIDEGQER